MSVVPQFPVLLHREAAFLIIPPPARLQFPDSVEHTTAGNTPRAQKQQLVRTIPIQLGFSSRITEDGFHFRSKQQSVFPLRVEKRLYPNPVPGQEKPLGILFPDGKSENPVEALHTFASPLGIGMEYDLGIGMAQEGMSCFFQCPADFQGIVQFPIIDQCVCFFAKGYAHGLPAALGIDDGQSGMEQGTAPLPEDALPIRSPAAHRFQHFPGSLLRNIQIDTACNCTHWITTSFRLSII